MVTVGISRWASCIALLLVGCSTGGGRLAARFPSRAEVQAISAAPPPSRIAQTGRGHVDRWELIGPLPDAVELTPHRDTSPWHSLLERVAQPRAGLVYLSEALHCAAREVGRFHLAKQALPPDSLRMFVGSRCGAGTGWLGLASVEGKVPTDVADGEVFSRWQENVRETITKNLPTGPSTAGIWFGRVDGRAVVVVATAQRRARIDPVRFVPAADGAVTIRGEMLTPTASVEGLINQGRFGVAACKADPSVRLPRFALRCPTEKSDDSAWLEVLAFPPGRIMGDSVFAALVAPSGQVAQEFVRPDPGPKPDPSVVPGGDLGKELVRRLNDVRREAGLVELQLSPWQSRTAATLAPYYFAANAGLLPEMLADKVVLGLLAGWDVQGIVRNGWFASAMARGPGDPAELLAAALERPSGRHALLQPTARQLGVGTVHDGEAQAVAGVFTTYSLFDQENYADATEALRQRLASERKKRGLAAPFSVSNLAGIASNAAVRLQQGQLGESAAMEKMLDEAGGLVHSPLRAWCIRSMSLEDVTFPEELLKAPMLRLAVSIAHHREEGDAWGHYVVFFLMVDGGMSV